MGRISNPKILLIDYFTQWFSDKNIVFATGQTEKGEQGTVHHQFYVVTSANPKNKNGWSLKWMKENLHPTAHWEGRRGTHQEAVDYVNKFDTRVSGPWTIGSWSEEENKKKAGSKGGQVNGSKILQIKEAIDEGATDNELYESHFGEMLRYGKAFDRYRMAIKTNKRTWQTKALCLWGPPGTGKSHRAQLIARTQFEDSVYNWRPSPGAERMFWDGYNGEKCVIVNEFYGNAPISYLLELLDKYPMHVETKGSAVPFVAEMVIFTSNEPPHLWYGKGTTPGEPSKIPAAVLAALARRFTGVCGTVLEMKDLVEAKDDEPIFEDVVKEMIRVAEEEDKVQQSKIPFNETNSITPPSIDLTGDDDDDVDDKTPPFPFRCGRCEEWNCICPERDQEQVNNDDASDDKELSTQELQKMKRHLYSQVDKNTIVLRDEPVPARLQRTDTTTFGLMRPPVAPDEAFRKLKQIPGQTKLTIIAGTKRPREEDE